MSISSVAWTSIRRSSRSPIALSRQSMGTPTFRAPMLTPRGHLFRQADHGNLWLRFDSSPLSSFREASGGIVLEKDVGVTAVHFESVLVPCNKIGLVL